MSLPRIEVQVVANGVSETVKALAGIGAAEEKLARNRDRIRERSATYAGKFAQQQAAAEAREMAKTQSAAERSAASVERAKEQSFKRIARWAEKQASDEIRAEQKKTQAIEAEARKQAGIRQRSAEHIGRSVASAVGSAVNTAKNLLVATAGIGGGFGLADSLRYGLKAGTAATNLQIASSGEVSKEEALASSKKTSLRTGIDQSDVIKGLQAYVGKTGKGAEGKEMLDFMADVSKSQNVDMGEIGKAMGQMRVQNKDATPAELQQLMLSAVAQGKAGSIEITDMAGALVKATASKSSYAGNGVENMKKLAGLTQIAMAGSSDAEMAGTAVAHLSTDIMREKDKWQSKLGIKVTDKSGKFLDDPVRLLEEMVVRTKGAPIAQAGLLGERSKYVATGMNDVYRAAEEKQKGSGREALHKYNEGVIKAQMSVAELQADLVTKMKDPIEVLNKVLNELRMNVGEQVLPEFVKLANKLPELVPVITSIVDSMVKLANWVVDNPLKAAFVTMGALMVEGIAKLFAAEAMSKLIAAAGPAGIIAAAIPLIAIGIASYVDHKSKEEKKAKEREGVSAAQKDLADLADLKQQQSDIESGKAPRAVGDVDMLNTVKGKVADKEEEIRSKTEKNKDLSDHIDDLKRRHRDYGGPTGLEFLGVQGNVGSLSPKEMEELNKYLHENPTAANGYAKTAGAAGFGPEKARKEEAENALRLDRIKRGAEQYGPQRPDAAEKIDNTAAGKEFGAAAVKEINAGFVFAPKPLSTDGGTVVDNGHKN